MLKNRRRLYALMFVYRGTDADGDGIIDLEAPELPDVLAPTTGHRIRPGDIITLYVSKAWLRQAIIAKSVLSDADEALELWSAGPLG